MAAPPLAGKRAMGVGIGLAAAIVAAIVVSDGTLKLTSSSTETTGATYRSAVAEMQGPSAQNDAMPREAAAKRTAPKAVEDKAPADADSGRQPEQAESALNLSDQDRERVQAALTALGYEAPTTGSFGPITRAAITAWQKTQALPATGFLDQSQLATLNARATLTKREGGQPKPDAQQAEAALNLSDQDRKQVQTALTGLGHEVPATGYFGPITRGAITAWQKTQGLAETSFLDQSQLATLSARAASAEREADTKPDPQQVEAALDLSEPGRKRVQAALRSLGQEVPTTGYFGPITRGAITAWQKTQGLPTTGYLTGAQLVTLQQQAAPALAKYDQAQRGAKDTPENK